MREFDVLRTVAEMKAGSARFFIRFFSICLCNQRVQRKEKSSNEIKIYNQGLTKSRENFVSKLVNLTNKYSKVTEEYLDELEEILIMADIGVNTVMEFMDRLRQRIKHENITSS